MEEKQLELPLWRLKVIVGLESADGNHEWVRRESYSVPRGFSLPILMEDFDDTVRNAIVIVVNKQKERAAREQAANAGD